MRFVWRLFGWLILLVIAVVGSAVVWLGGTETGSRWLLERTPGLEAEGFSGRLGRSWQATRLVWTQGDRRVVLEAPSMHWRPACLARLTLCIEQAQVHQLELTFPPGADTTPGPPELPELRLPFGLELGRLEVGNVVYNDQPVLEHALLSGRWTQRGLTIETLEARGAGGRLSLSGVLRPEGRWPLQLKGQAQVPTPGERPEDLVFSIAGELQRTLTVQVTGQGYAEASLSGELQPLAPTVPAQLRLTSPRWQPTPTLPPELTLEALSVALVGDLEQGYRLDGQATLPGRGGPVALRLQGVLRREGLRLEQLALRAAEQRFLQLQGAVGWQDHLQADVTVHWLDFPWQWLYPRQGELPVALQELSGQMQYEDGSYLGHFDARLLGPAGEFTLASPVSGNLETVHLPQLELVAGQGRASGNLSLGFGETLSWSTRLELSALDPAYWLEAVPGSLAGALASEGRLAEGTLQARADLALQGRLREQPARIALRLAGQPQDWQVSDLDLRLGDNRISGDGHWGDTLAGTLTLQLDRLAQLWPGLAGQASGELRLSGTPAAPGGALTLKGDELAFGNRQLADLRLQARVDEGVRGQLTLGAGGLRIGETALGDLRANAQGSLERHTAALQLDGPLASLDLALQGGLQGERWLGQLRRVEVQGLEQRWALRAPTALERQADGTVLLGPHCWVSAPATLCAERQRVFPEPQLRYRLRDFPLQRLASALPEDFGWQGQLGADIDLTLLAAGPQGNVRLDAGPGTLRLREVEGEGWLDFPYRELAAVARLTPEQVDLRLDFAGEQLGDFRLQAQVDPRGEDKALQGTFRLAGLNVGVLRPFLPKVDRLQGTLAGSGTVAGTLRDPQVRGALRLSDGLVAGDQLPTRLENLQLQLQIAGRQVDIAGDWRAGEKGRGGLHGTLEWAGEPRLDLAVTGSDLPVVVEPYAELEVSPALNIRLADQGLAISGQLNVPRGEVHVRDLPPSTVRVSPDTVIVGEPEQTAEEPLDIALDIDVQVGQERLRFTGLGLTGDLVGQLHIGDNLDTRGELVMKNGRYRAYGQRLALRRARLLFTGPLSQPFLDVEAVRRIEAEDVTAGLRITGSTRNPEIDVFAEPAMSQEQALSYLVLGRAPGAQTGDNNLLAQAALGLGLSRSARLTGALADRLGVEDFQLETEGSGADTSVVASGRLSDRLSLRYGVGVFQPVNTLSLRYQLTRRLFLEAAAGLANSLDLFYRRDF